MAQMIQKPQSQPNQALAKKNTIGELLEARKDFLAKVLPKHMTPERLIKVALFAAARNQRLLQCTPLSVLRAIMECAELGLEPSGSVGGAHLVPYWNKKAGAYECQLIPDYRGLVDLSRRSGQVLSIEAHAINANDDYEIKFGLNPVLEHSPTLTKEPGPMVAVYAVAKLRDGATQCEVMTKSQVDRIRDRSKAKEDGPWVTDYESMAKKTVLKQLCKYLPRSRELARALELEDSFENDDTPIIEMDLPEELQTPAPPPPPSKTDKLRAQLTGKQSRVVDVADGETEEQAMARASAEPSGPPELPPPSGPAPDDIPF